MTTLNEEVAIEAGPDFVWAAVRDVGAVHTHLAPGFVVAVELEDGARVVTFADGVVIRELIVGVDDAARRLAYAAVGAPGRSHHNASIQVFADSAPRSRLVWITDVLPAEAAVPNGTAFQCDWMVQNPSLA